MTASPEGFPPQDLRSFLELCAGEWLALRSHFDLVLVDQADPAAATADAQDSSSPASGPVADAAVGSAADSSGDSGGSAATAPAPEASADPALADDGLPDFAALLQQARAGVEEAPEEEPWHSSLRAELQVAFLVPDQQGEPGGLRITPPDGVSRELHFRGDGGFGPAPGGAREGCWQLWSDGSVELTTEAAGRVLRERIWFTQPNLRLRSSVEHGPDGLPGRARFSSEIRRVRKPAP